MRYVLLAVLGIVLISMCAGFNIPFINSGNVSEAGFITVDSGNPKTLITAEAIPTEVKSGRNVTLKFEINNENPYSLKNVKLNVYDTCVFTGDTNIPAITEIKANRTDSISLKLKSDYSDLDKTCNIKFRISYEASQVVSQDIAVLSASEYDNREASGTLGSVPIQSSSQDGPLSVGIRFSDSQPFYEKEKYYMYIDYRNTGQGLLNVSSGGIKINKPGNVKDFSCDDYDSGMSLKDALSFISGRAPESACSFAAVASQPLSIESLSLEANYKYTVDSSISVTVKKATGTAEETTEQTNGGTLPTCQSGNCNAATGVDCCPDNCVCPSGTSCVSGSCAFNMPFTMPTCNSNGICEAESGEDCTNCPNDCTC